MSPPALLPPSSNCAPSASTLTRSRVRPTMDRAVWVCCSSGSGSREMCTHSGMVTVPPSRSAMITSSCEEEDNVTALAWTVPPAAVTGRARHISWWTQRFIEKKNLVMNADEFLFVEVFVREFCWCVSRALVASEVHKQLAGNVLTLTHVVVNETK